MLTLSRRPTRTLAVLAALWFCSALAPVHAANAPAAQPITPGISGGVLSAISDPHPYRQTRIVDCTKALFGAPDACLVAFGKIPAGQLLQIDNINCGGVNGAFIEIAYLFNTDPKFDADHLVATLPTTTSHIVTVSGPFYFKEGEVPRVATAGHAVGDQVYCSVAGTLWKAN
jgi:hypothetical protein